MAITGCFAGPLFDLLLGMSITTFKLLFEYGEFEFNIVCKEGIYGLIGFGFVLGLIGLDLVSLPINNYRYNS